MELKMAALRLATVSAIGLCIDEPRTGPRARSKRCPLTEFEHHTILAVQHCGPDAYGIKIAERLLPIYGPGLALGQVYMTLKRLEGKGFLSSYTSDPKSVRGGRARRVFVLEGKGVTALEMSTVFRDQALAASRRLEEAANEKDARLHPNGGILPQVA